MKRFYSLCCLIALLTGLWACNEDFTTEPFSFLTIRGQVLTNANRTPISRAVVRLSPSGRSVETDSVGRFRFDSLALGRYTVQTSKEGFTQEFVTVESDGTAGTTLATLTVLLNDDKSQRKAPSVPVQLNPFSSTVTNAGSGTTVAVSPLLRWRSSSPGRDSLFYDVAIYRAGSQIPSLQFTNLKVDSLRVTGLSYNTIYYWQVTVRDGVNTVKGDLWSFRTAPFPDWQYAFTRRVNGAYQLFAATTAGEVLPLTQSSSNWRPIASPNRQQVAFISNRETDLHLFIMDRDGNNVRQVTAVPIAGAAATDLSFCWSPDGTQLLYPANNRLYAIRTDGTGLRTVATAATGRFFTGCDWTSQGNLIAARTSTGNVYDNELVLIPANGGFSSAVLSRRSNRVGNPVFSLDGRQLLFTIDQSVFQNEEGRQLDARIFLLDLVSNTLTDLSSVRTDTQTTINKPTGSNDLDPRFSPTGSRVIFVNTENSGFGPRNIVAVDLDGRSRTQLIANGEMPYWR